MSKKISFNTNLIYFIVLSIFVVLRICSNFGLFAFLGDYAGFVLGIFTQVGIIFLLPFVLFKILNKKSPKQVFAFFNFRKVSSKTVILAVVLGVVVFVLNIFVSSFFNGIIQFWGYKPSAPSGSSLPSTWWVLILNLLVTAVLPGICEETLHRGMLLNGNSNLGVRKTVLVSGLLFGLLHLNIEQFFYASIIGIFLGYLCMFCNSIYPCIIVHFMNNALSVFLSFARTKGWAVGNIFEGLSKILLSKPVIGFVLLVVLLLILLMLAWEIVKYMIVDNFEYNFGKRQKELTNKAIRERFFKQVECIKSNEDVQKNIYSVEKDVLLVDFAQFLDIVSKEMENENQAQGKPADLGKQMEKMELRTKILLWGSFALSAIVTIMTFIWGLFR